MTDIYTASTSTTGTLAAGGSISSEVDTTSDKDWFRITLTADRTYQFDLAGSATIDQPELYLRNGTGAEIFREIDFNNARITFAPTSSGTYYLSAGSWESSELGTYTLSAADIGPVTDIYAASTATTGTLAIGGSITSEVDTTSDKDWFRITLTAGRTYQFDLAGSATIDQPELYLRNGTGAEIFREIDFNNARITFAPTSSGTYYLSAGTWESSELGTYTLSAADITPGPNTTPFITSNGGADTASIIVSENGVAVTTVTATDSDAGSVIAYSIAGGADQARFHVNALTGALSFIGGPNFETPTDADANNSYIVQVRASDGSLFDDQTITVNVTDVREPTNDFNGDGKADMLFQQNNGTLAVWLMDGTTPTALAQVSPNPGPTWHVKASGDFGADGKSEILWQNDSGLPAIWTMNGTSFTAGALLYNPGPTWHIQEAADFSGDGRADILWQNDNGTPAIWLMDGSTMTTAALLVNPQPSWHVKAAADFSGDGKADILWQNDNGDAAIWLMDGLTLASATQLSHPAGGGWDIKAAGDFDLDGKADIIWQNNSTGQPLFWKMDGLTKVGETALINPGASWHAVEAFDMSGDGKADIQWQNDNGTPAVWLMNGAALTSAALLPNPTPEWHLI
jgi:hypothetical protein